MDPQERLRRSHSVEGLVRCDGRSPAVVLSAHKVAGKVALMMSLQTLFTFREVELQDLWRLRGTRQKLVFVPDLQEVIGEKDRQVPAAEGGMKKPEELVVGVVGLLCSSCIKNHTISYSMILYTRTTKEPYHSYN